MIHGDVPPLDVMPADGLRRADAEYLLILTQQDWIAKHDEKNRLSGPPRDALSDELRRIEAVQNKLRVLL